MEGGEVPIVCGQTMFFARDFNRTLSGKGKFPLLALNECHVYDSCHCMLETRPLDYVHCIIEGIDLALIWLTLVTSQSLNYI